MKNTGKKIWLIVGILILAAAVFIGVRFYSQKKEDPYHTFLKPRLELTYYKIKKMTKETIDMDLMMLVDNPLPAGVKLSNLEYKIYINDVEVMKSKYAEDIDLDANDSSLITLPIIVKNETMMNVLKKLEEQKADSADYRIEGKVQLNFLSFKNKSHDFDFTKRAPAIFIPSVTVERIDVKRIKLKNTKVEIELIVNNPNIFPIEFKDTHFKLSFDGDEFVSGDAEQLIKIPAKGQTKITLPTEINLKEAVEAAWDALFKSAKTNYKLFLETKIHSDDNSLKNSQFMMEADGNLKELKEMR